MTPIVDDVRIKEIKELAPPAHILREFPATEAAAATTFSARHGIHRILHGADGRLLVVEVRVTYQEDARLHAYAVVAPAFDSACFALVMAPSTICSSPTGWDLATPEGSTGRSSMLGKYCSNTRLIPSSLAGFLVPAAMINEWRWIVRLIRRFPR